MKNLVKLSDEEIVRIASDRASKIRKRSFIIEMLASEDKISKLTEHLSEKLQDYIVSGGIFSSEYKGINKKYKIYIERIKINP